MPLVAVDRISLPSLRTYTAVSVVLLSISVYYAVHVSNDTALKVNLTKSETDLDQAFENSERQGSLLLSNKSQNETFVRQVKQAARYMVQEPFSVWQITYDTANTNLFLLYKNLFINV
ncbi:hypothetical protein RUM43_004086 [Polyplax serrata]|uniref:Uncharacterized protein n=1 Tax=Polyplax serrata TaxID=468196 RepID=A0AAN8SB36_POLSC